MLKLYQTNLLTVVNITEYSVYVEGEDGGSMPLHEAPDEIEIGDDVWAFVYSNSSDELVATMEEARNIFGLGFTQKFNPAFF